MCSGVRRKYVCQLVFYLFFLYYFFFFFCADRRVLLTTLGQVDEGAENRDARRAKRVLFQIFPFFFASSFFSEAPKSDSGRVKMPVFVTGEGSVAEGKRA